MRRDSFSIAPPSKKKIGRKKGRCSFLPIQRSLSEHARAAEKESVCLADEEEKEEEEEGEWKAWVGWKSCRQLCSVWRKKGVGEKKREGLDVARRDDQFLGLENRFRMFSDFTLEIETNNGPILNLYSSQLHFLIVSSDYGTRMKWNEAIYPPE